MGNEIKTVTVFFIYFMSLRKNLTPCQFKTVFQNYIPLHLRTVKWSADGGGNVHRFVRTLFVFTRCTHYARFCFVFKVMLTFVLCIQPKKKILHSNLFWWFSRNYRKKNNFRLYVIDFWELSSQRLNSILGNCFFFIGSYRLPCYFI